MGKEEPLLLCRFGLQLFGPALPLQAGLGNGPPGPSSQKGSVTGAPVATRVTTQCPQTSSLLTKPETLPLPSPSKVYLATDPSFPGSSNLALTSTSNSSNLVSFTKLLRTQVWQPFGVQESQADLKHLKLPWPKILLNREEKVPFLSLADESIAGTPNSIIKRRRRRRNSSRGHCVTNIMFICYDYICSKIEEKIRDSFSKSMKPRKGNVVQRNLSPGGASLCVRLGEPWSDTDTWVKMTPYDLCGGMGAWRAPRGWAQESTCCEHIARPQQQQVIREPWAVKRTKTGRLAAVANFMC